jgi:hypothetical protein
MTKLSGRLLLGGMLAHAPFFHGMLSNPIGVVATVLPEAHVCLGSNASFDGLPITSGLPQSTDIDKPAQLVRSVPKAEAASIFEPHLLVRGTRVATGDDGVRVGLCENKLTPPSSGQRR